MAAVEAVFEQALQLKEDAWSEEIDRRVREIRDGKVELIDGDEAMARVRRSLAARRP